MKRKGHLMEQILSLDNLYLAYQKACRGKKRKQEVLRFAANFDDNIARMRKEMADGSIAIGNYHYFTIHDPKERIICAAPFEERVLQHAIMNVCHPVFNKGLIETTFATRKEKGVYAALDKAVEAITKYPFSVKLDFRKYYDSISHDLLKSKLRRLFKDPKLLALFDRIIDSYQVEEGRGLPIGNLTSQYFANLYLSDLDHKAKEVWKVPIYIRYMDDILMVANQRLELKQNVKDLTTFSSQVLKLSLKPPIFRKNQQGQIFLGYRILPHHYRLSGRSKRRYRHKLLTYQRLLRDEKWSEQEYSEHILPLLSFALHAESKGFRKSCLEISR